MNWCRIPYLANTISNLLKWNNKFNSKLSLSNKNDLKITKVYRTIKIVRIWRHIFSLIKYYMHGNNESGILQMRIWTSKTLFRVRVIIVVTHAAWVMQAILSCVGVSCLNWNEPLPMNKFNFELGLYPEFRRKQLRKFRVEINSLSHTYLWQALCSLIFVIEQFWSTGSGPEMRLKFVSATNSIPT